MRVARSFVLEFARTDTPEDPHAFCFTPQDYTLRVADGRRGRLRIPWDNALLAEFADIRRPDRDPAAIQRLGERLRGILEPAGWATIGRELLHTIEGGQLVSVTIRSNAAELYAIPWELLTIGPSGRHLGELRDVLVRYEWPGTSTAPPSSPNRENGRVVFAWSAAGGSVPADEHRRAIESACRSGHIDFDRERDVVDHVSVDRLGAALGGDGEAGPAAILHLLCHGGAAGSTFGLVLDDADGEAVTVDAARLRQLLAPHSGHLRLVVLAACDGGNAGDPGNQLGSVAQALHRAGIAAIVASRYPLSVAGSEALAAELYHALLVDLCSLEEAFTRVQACLAGAPARLDWASLTYHARAGDGEDSRPIVFRPYRGLLAFEAEHARFFFGREAERQEVFDDLRALVAAGKPRFLVVAGASGTGKSSMVLAGVVPKLAVTSDGDAGDTAASQLLARARRDLEEVARRLHGGFAREALKVLDHGEASRPRDGGPWSCKVIRPGNRPIESLDAAIKANDGGRLLLVVDQFEEIFTLTDRQEIRERYARRLWTLSQGDTGVHCVITIRVDFLGHCGDLVLDDRGTRLDRIAYDETHRIFVAQIGDAQLRAVIERPAAKVGLRLAPGLVEQIVSAGREPGALPLIQYALDRLWLERRGRVIGAPSSDKTTVDVVVTALEHWADKTIADLNAEELAQARRLLTRLVEVNDDDFTNTRRRVPLSTLEPNDEATLAIFRAVLDKLVSARLVVRGDETGTTTLEIAHEALIRKWERMRGWLDLDRGKLGELKTLERWVEECIRGRTLLVDDRLGYAIQVVTRHPDDVDDRARALVDASRQRARLRQGALVGVAGLFIVLGTVALLLWQIADKSEAEARSAEREARSATLRAEEQKEVATSAEQKAEANARRARDGVRVAAANSELDDAALAIGLLREIEVDPEDPKSKIRGWSRGALNVLGRPWVERVRLRAQQGKVVAARFNDDGALVVTASDRSARVWRARDGELLAKFGEHEGAVLSAVLSQDGTRVLTTSDDDKVHLWSMDGGLHVDIMAALGEEVVTTDEDREADKADEADGEDEGDDCSSTHATRAFFSPDSARIFVIDVRGEGLLWDVELGAQTGAPIAHGPITSASFSADSRRLLTAHSDDNSARLWDVDTGAPAATLAGASDPYVWVGFDGERGVTVTSDGAVTIWDLERERRVQTIPRFADDEQFIADSGIDAPMYVDDDGATILRATGTSVTLWTRASRAQAYLPGASFGISGGGDGRPAPIYDRRAGWLAGVATEPSEQAGTAVVVNPETLAVLGGHGRPVRSFDFSPGAERLLTASDDSTARIWAQKPALSVTSSVVPVGAPDVLELSPDGGFVLLKESEREVVTIRRIGGADSHVLDVPSAPGSRPKVAFRPDASLAAVAGTGVKLVDLGSMTILQEFGPRDENGDLVPVSHVAFSPGGDHVLVDAFEQVGVWEAETGEKVTVNSTRARGSDDSRRSVLRSVFNPKTPLGVLTLLNDGTLSSWEAREGAEAQVRRIGLCQIPRSVVFAAEAQALVMPTMAGPINIWDPDTGALRAELGSIRVPVYPVAVDPAGRLLAGVEEGVARVWNLTEMSEVAVLHGHRGKIRALVFSPDGSQLLTASDDHTARLWDVESGLLLTVVRHRAPVRAVAFAADGSRALSISVDGELKSVDLASKELLKQLWRATRVCPSAEQREALLGLDAANAGLDAERCEAMIRCAYDEELRADFDDCLAEFRRAQGARSAFIPRA